MQLTFISRGIKHEQDRMITELQGIHFPIKLKNKKTGQIVERTCQMSVRPIQIYELAFPEPYLDAVIGSLWSNDPKYGIQHKIVEHAIKPLRIALKSEKMPKWKAPVAKLPFRNKHLNNVAIGIRKDKETDFIDENGEEYTVEGI